KAYPPSLTMGRDPTSYLIIFIHIPSAWNMFAAFTIALAGGILYLYKGRLKYDAIVQISVILGLIYGFVAIVTGMLWASEIWGSPWNWDPRQTSTLTLLLAYIGYLALRKSISDIDRARVFSSVYAIAAYITLPLTYLSAVLFQSLHTQIPGQPLTSNMKLILWPKVLVSFLILISFYLLYYRVFLRRGVE
ncbi:TPA: hypothetical protein EYP83_02160, partial [Candidatus Geothermarchaeota archaeon]|nr:hypothetical protein [Candidatus Geothermarchaeota archaeon]